MNFNTQQLKIIYKAINYYKTNAIPFSGKEYDICDEISSNIFKENFQENGPRTN